MATIFIGYFVAIAPFRHKPRDWHFCIRRSLWLSLLDTLFSVVLYCGRRIVALCSLGKTSNKRRSIMHSKKFATYRVSQKNSRFQPFF